jgi:hypothetical protein
MCYWLLPVSGVPIAHTTIQALSSEELENDETKSQSIEEKFSHDPLNPQNLLLYREDQDDDLLDDVQVEPESLMPNTEDIEADMYDSLLLIEPILCHNCESIRAKVIGRKHNQDGNPIGTFHPNPLLSTRVYLAEFPDGHVVELSANTIAEAIFNQVDEDEYDLSLFKDIIGHEQDSTALLEEEKQLIGNLQDSEPVRNSNKMNPMYTTRGWKICIEWHDSTTSWLPLTDVKNSFPVHLAQYVVENNLHNLPAFSWWVKYTLKKKRVFIKATKSTYSQRTHKFGIKVPKTVQEALSIDEQTNTNYWYNAIQKEMTNNKSAFKFLEENENVPVGYKWIRCHMIVDVRKARFVAGGHMNDPPESITYSSVVSRDIVCIAFHLAALNDIDILAIDIGNAYLNAQPHEKVYTTAGPEFGAELQGKAVLIARALYGLKSSGAAWCSHLANTLHQMGFISCLADPDIWYCPATKPNGFQYYEYVLVYVDDVLTLSHQGDKIMKGLEEFYHLKDGFKKPELYLGAEIKQWIFPDQPNLEYWAISSARYVKEVIKNIELHLQTQGRT